MPPPVIQHEAPHPVDIGVFRSPGVMSRAQTIPKLLEQPILRPCTLFCRQVQRGNQVDRVHLHAPNSPLTSTPRVTIRTRPLPNHRTCSAAANSPLSCSPART